MKVIQQLAAIRLSPGDIPFDSDNFVLNQFVHLPNDHFGVRFSHFKQFVDSLAVFFSIPLRISPAILSKS